MYRTGGAHTARGALANDLEELNSLIETSSDNAGNLADNSSMKRRVAKDKSRDLLLLRCRDAIEELHAEIEEERSVKGHLQREIQELQQYAADLQLQDQELQYNLQSHSDENQRLQAEINDL